MIGPKSLAVVGARVELRVDPHLNPWVEAGTSPGKGILMTRHSTNVDRAFEMVRDHFAAQRPKLVDIAQAIVDSHLLLPPLQQPAPPEHRW